jgi:ankyrin repeat protein
MGCELPNDGGHRCLLIRRRRFRWVYCQLDFLRRCLPARIERALTELPETLDDTYERTLRDIGKANWEFAHRLLQCVTAACRPLRVEELAEFLAFDFKAGPIPEFSESFRPADPIHAVLSTCPSLLSIVDEYGSKVIQFSHFSVKEYLMSARLVEGSDITSRRYHVSMTGAHTIAAQACLGILLYLDENINSYNLEKFPLAAYAAKHWIDHVQLEDVSQRVEAGLKQLFDPRKPHLTIWLRIHDPASHIYDLTDQEAYRRPSQPNGTCLHYAALCGLHRIIEFLVTEHGQEVNSLGFEDGSTPLHVAVQGRYSGAASVTRVLMKFGADAMAWNKDQRTPLHMVVGSPSQAMEVVQALIAGGADVTAQDKDGCNPLHSAAWPWSSQADVVRALIAAGADAMAQDKGGRNPLHNAAGSSSSQAMKVVQALIEAGTDATAQDEGGRNPLHDAAESSSLQAMEVVRALIKAGTDATAQDKDGRNPLHLAAWSSSSQATKVARALIEAGADATTQDEDGRNPLHLAAWSESSQAMEVVRVLIEGGADVTARDKDGRNPLHLAAWSWSSKGVEVIRALIEAGADTMAQDKYGRHPLHLAAESWWPRAVNVVRALIEAGADATAQDEGGCNPLHFAAGSRSPYAMEVVRALVEAGADATAQDKDGLTPTHEALSEGRKDVAEFLRGHGTISLSA